MPIPDYQSLMLPVLRITEDRQEHPVAQMRSQIAAQLSLSEEELAHRLASDSQTVFASRVAWAVQYLKQAGALVGVRRGVYKITDRGISLLQGKPSEITNKTLRQFPEFTEFEGKGSASAESSIPTIVASDPKSTPEESLENNYQILRDALANDLLETIKNGTPAAFEQIVVDLLVAMGASDA